MSSGKPTNVTEYIEGFPPEVQKLLNEVRATIQKAAPHAAESISYAIPTYKLEGKPLIYFAAFENHIGLYAAPTGHGAFEAELAQYKQGRGSVQFPLNEPMPLDLIKRIVEVRIRQLNCAHSDNI